MMKKIIIALIFTLCMSGVSLSQGTPGSLSDSDIAYIKAVVAKEVNEISLGALNDSKAETALNIITGYSEDNLTLSNIKSAVKDFKVNVKLIEDIEKSKISKDLGAEGVVDKLFETECLKSFFSKSERNPEKAKVKIRKVINKRFNREIVSFENAENSNLEKASQKPNPDRAARLQDSQRNEKTESFNFLWLLLLIPVLALVAGMIIIFRKWKEEEVKANYLNERVHDLKKRCEDFEKKYKDLNNRFLSLEQEKANLQAEISEMRNRERSARETSSQTKLQQQERFDKEKLYAFQAEDGVFAYVSNSNSGESMYEITTISENSGTYVFINSSMAVAAAQNSRSMFIESACEILNEETRRFSQIETVTPGHVSKTSRGWIIVKKAQVRLA